LPFVALPPSYLSLAMMSSSSSRSDKFFVCPRPCDPFIGGYEGRTFLSILLEGGSGFCFFPFHCCVVLCLSLSKNTVDFFSPSPFSLFEPGRFFSASFVFFFLLSPWSGPGVLYSSFFDAISARTFRGRLLFSYFWLISLSCFILFFWAWFEWTFLFFV